MLFGAKVVAMPILSLSCFSNCICSLAALVIRGLRVIPPPLAVAVVASAGAAARAALPLAAPEVALALPPLPRPLPRFWAPSPPLLIVSLMPKMERD